MRVFRSSVFVTFFCIALEQVGNIILRNIDDFFEERKCNTR